MTHAEYVAEADAAKERLLEWERRGVHTSTDRFLRDCDLQLLDSWLWLASRTAPNSEAA